MSGIKCEICPHSCVLEEGKTGFCGARENRGGKIISSNYGMVTSIALDPIEKKPLKRFFPGCFILSVGSFGCNLRCPFCQNYEISFCGKEREALYISPEELIKKAMDLRRMGNIGIAYTYNEPLIGYEYVLNSAETAAENGLKNVLVTNGYINEKPLKNLLEYIDAMNIDLKSFSSDFYKKIGGDLETVKNTIRESAKKCHVEVTTLIIPNENDSPEEMEELARWLSSVDENIPLHITRFFPRYEMSDRGPTPINKIYELAKIARERLKFVYEGNC